MKPLSRILIITILLFKGAFLNAQAENPYKERVDSLLSLMTLQEKLGQLNLPTSGDITTGQAKSSNVAQNIKDGKVGGLFNVKSAKKIHEIQRIAVEESRLGIPLLFGMDVIHGYKTTFPIPLGLASSWDTDLIQKTARMAAQEASADGINWTFSPMTDISKDARWGRVSESAGEDAYLGSRIAEAMVQGYQGKDLLKNNTILSCLKHFALYGAVEAGKEYNTVDMSKNRMYNEYFPPYKAAVDAGVESVMASFNDINGVPATANHWLLTEVLRNQWGFKGFVVSDYTAVEELQEHGIGDNLEDVSALALKAGLDMDMVSEGLLSLEKPLKEGKITLQEIDQAVRRILTAKFKLGLFDNPYKYCDVTRAEKEIYTPKNRDFARKVAAESMVLLKNEGNILPLKKNQKIALIGAMANSSVNMAGTWSVATDQGKSISVLEGFKQFLGQKGMINYAKGSNLVEALSLEQKITMFGKEIPRDGRTDEEMIKEAVEAAKKSDVVVAVVGESAEYSGECTSRTNLQLPQIQKNLLAALKKTGKPMVIVLFTGRPLALVDIDEQYSTILNVWFPGSEAGLAITDVVFGEVNPSGKIPMTFPRNVGQVPIYYNHKNTGRPVENKEGNFEKFKANYIDVRNEPLYPFGYGLSYTTFSYSAISLSKDKMNFNDTITAKVNITNTGNYDGAEVVQLYLRDKIGSITRPVKELKGFQKIFLKKGENKTVSFTITVEDLKFYDHNLDFVAEPGEFEIAIAPSSDFEFKNSFTLIKN